MALTIFTTENNGRTLKAKIAAQYAGVEIKEVIVKMGEGNKTPEYLANFPLGKVPAALTAEGLPLVESGAIARHVARINPSAGLFGNSFYQGSLVDQWIDFGTLELEALGPKWLWQVFGYFPYNADITAQGKEAVAKTLKILDDNLVKNTFITGDTITLADISVFCNINPYFTHLITESQASDKWPSVVRWFKTLLIQNEFKIANFKWAETERLAAGASASSTSAPAPVVEKKAAPVPEPVATPAAEEPKKGKGKQAASKKEEPAPTPAPEPVKTPEPTPTPASPEPKKGAAKKGKQEPKVEAKKEEPPASPKVEAKKAEAKKETPKAAAKAEPKVEAKKEAPAPKAEPKTQASPKAAAPKGKAGSKGKGK